MCRVFLRYAVVLVLPFEFLIDFYVVPFIMYYFYCVFSVLFTQSIRSAPFPKAAMRRVLVFDPSLDVGPLEGVARPHGCGASISIRCAHLQEVGGEPRLRHLQAEAPPQPVAS